MSMLAEQRRRTKWVVNPTKKPIWSTDSSGIKFGKQLMEKMGWSAGKGLGLNEQGIQEPLKVSFKNDTKGMGFKGNDDDWIEQQDEFNILLNQLRNQDDASAVTSSHMRKNEVKSLEERSKQSKARVHYQKFTRGKDLSRYSENDLACILGTNKVKKKENSKTEEIIETKTNGNCETSFGVTTINSGSINDYFKKKWTADKVKTNELTRVNDEEENFRPSFYSEKSHFPVNQDEESKKVYKSKFEKEELQLEENRTPEVGFANGIENVEKRKRKIEVEINSEKPRSKKKRKNDVNDNSSEESKSLSLENESCVYEEKRRGKNKNKLEVSGDEVKLKKEKIERKGRKEQLTTEELQESHCEKEEESNSINDRDATLEVKLVKRKKKKKNKKNKLEENEVHENECNYDSQVKPLSGSCLEVEEEVKHKKEKWIKKQKLEKSDNSSDIQDASPSDHSEKTGGKYHNEDILKVVAEKKKKKKNKKEKIEECCETNHILPSGKITAAVEMNDENELVELESRRKKKKKSKKENREIENEGCGNQIEEPCLQTTEETNVQSKEEELVKKKKKKKDKKEVESKGEKSCLEKSKNDENDMDVQFCREKKKKKDKKGKVEDSGGIEGKDEQSCQFKTSEEVSVEMKEPGDEINVKETESTGSNGIINTNPEEQRIQKLRGNLFPDTAAEKYFPRQSTNERVLKLIRWANIAEFKGSNLRDVEGYGRWKTYEKQSR